MGRIITRNQPCLRCNSSDAAQIYDDGLTHCFSCNKTYKAAEYGGHFKTDNFRRSQWEHKNLSIEDISVLPSVGWKERRLLKPAMEFYGVKASYNEAGEVDAYYFPCANTSLTAITSYHVRDPLDKKNTRHIGTPEGIYGLELFKNGGKRVIVTEGQPDMLAIASSYYTSMKTFYPVVTMGSAINLKALVAAREQLRKFDEIVLWFDNDEQGLKASSEAAKILGFDKVKLVKTKFKDANDMLMSEPDYETSCKLMRFAIADAKAYNPSGILGKEEVWKQLVDYQELDSLSYPEEMEELNKLTKGFRQGEITLFTSGTSTGKSSIVRQIALHTLHTHKKAVGMIMLEESPAETVRKLSGLALGINPSEQPLELEELRKGFDIVYEGDRLQIVDHAGASTDSRLLDLIEFMALTGVTHVILDHLTMAVSEGIQGLVGNEAQDKFMNELLRIVKRHNIWVCLISHLRKTQTGKSFEEGEMPTLDDIKGSGSAKQVSMDVIGFARNTQAENEIEKNTMKLRVLKCRYTGLTGNAGALHYDRKSGILKKSDVLSVLEEFELIQ